MHKINQIIKKNKELILYIFFGVISTAINIIVYYALSNYLNINYLISNFIAWILSVLFAFITNKFLVFQGASKKSQSSKELILFIAARVLSLFIDMIIIYTFIEIFKINSLISKIFANVVVIVINYLFSKFFIFTSDNNKNIDHNNK